MNNSQLISVSVPEQVSPGQQFEARFTFLNTGDTTWMADGANAHKLGSQGPDNNTIWGRERFLMPAGTLVLPGQQFEFVGQLTAPQQQGSQTCRWRMVQENIEWFGQTAAPFVYVGQSILTQSAIAFPRLPASGDDLVGGLVCDTSPVVADGLKRIVRWTNNLNVTLKVWKAYIWSGVQLGVIGDVHAELGRASDKSVLAFNQWDRYAEPTAPDNRAYVDYAKPFLLEHGDSLDLLTVAVQFGGPVSGLHHHRAAIWATI